MNVLIRSNIVKIAKLPGKSLSWSGAKGNFLFTAYSRTWVWKRVVFLKNREFIVINTKIPRIQHFLLILLFWGYAEASQLWPCCGSNNCHVELDALLPDVTKIYSVRRKRRLWHVKIVRNTVIIWECLDQKQKME